MRKYYITSDKIGEFVARMYAAGVRVDVQPKEKELCVHTKTGYEWIQVFDKSSFEELCAAYMEPTSKVEPNTLG